MRELFFETLAIFYKSCALTIISSDFFSSQAIKLDSESLCTLSRFDFITDA